MICVSILEICARFLRDAMSTVVETISKVSGVLMLR